MRFEYTSNQSNFGRRNFEFVVGTAEVKFLIISMKKMHEMSKLSEFWQLSPPKNRETFSLLILVNAMHVMPLMQRSLAEKQGFNKQLHSKRS